MTDGISAIELARARLGRLRRRAQASIRPRVSLPAEVVAHTEVERILPPPQVAPRGQTVLTLTQQFDYGDPARGMAYEETAFLHTLLHMGFEVRRFDFATLAARYGTRTMNEALMEAVHLWQPRLVFAMLTGDQLDPEALRAIRRPGLTTLNWFADDQWRFEQFSMRWAPEFDAVVTTSEEAAARYATLPGVRAVLSQFGFDPTFFRKIERPKTHDVAFIGLPHSDRRATIERIRSEEIEVVTRGVGWPEGRASFREMAELWARSRICLNLSATSSGNVHQVKGRDFEVPGSGELLLTQAHPAIERYFVPGEEIATYRDADDLVPQIRALLADDARRERIAAAGYERAHGEHTYRHRFEAIFSELGID